MPQMAPSMWLMLYFTLWLVVFCTKPSIYFLSSLSSEQKSKQLLPKKLDWIW